MNKNKQKPLIRSPKYKVRNRIVYVIWIAFGLLFLIRGTKRTVENYHLKKEGICVQAVVYHKYQAQHKKVRCYEFRVGEKKYRGKTITDHKLKVGDSLTIIYLPSNPEINRSNTVINKDCF